MIRILLIIGFLLSGPLCFGQLNGRCDIFGQIFLTDNPQRAHYKVFVESSENSADLVVFEEENGLMADREGLWHYTENEAFARFILFFTENEYEADFTIYYTDIPDYAGCN